MNAEKNMKDGVGNVLKIVLKKSVKSTRFIVYVLSKVVK